MHVAIAPIKPIVSLKYISIYALENEAIELWLESPEIVRKQPLQAQELED